MDLQLIVTLALTLLATSYLIWSVIRPFVGRKKSSCGGCGSCASARKPTEGSTTFVPVEGLTVRSSRSGG